MVQVAARYPPFRAGLMSLEIERKFLVAHDGWKSAVTRRARIRDGLVSMFNGRKTRVRMIDGHATLTVKSEHTGSVRSEFEYAIPVADAEEMLRTMCDDRVLEKTRNYVLHDGLTWEIDVYEGLLDGVVIAEVELDRADRGLALPDWVGREVTEDANYRKLKMLQDRTAERRARAG
jgi:CYTH domain-containing protein